MSDIKDWADSADLNGEASPAGWPEGMPPSDVNNSAREMMAALRRSYVRQPWYAPGGEIIRVSGTRITIKDDAKVTNYSQFYSVNQRVRVEGEEYNVMGSVSSISYEEPTTTIEFEMDAELQLPGTIKEVYVGLSPSDVQGVAGPNLLGCIIGFTEEASQIGAGLLHANGQKFSPSLYPDLARLYFMGNNSDGTPNYRYGREKVGNEWWPKRPDVRGYFPRFLDDRVAPGKGEKDNRVDADSPRTVGSVQGDAIRNLTGRATTGAEYMGTGQLQEGVLSVEVNGNYYRNRSADYGNAAVIKVDASKQVPTAEENRPKNIAVVGVIVAYGGVVAGGLADVSELVDMTTEVKNQALEALQKINGVDIVNVRGTVTTYDELPRSADIGDLYKENSTGTYYMWSEQGSWDALAGRLRNSATGSKSLAISTDGSTGATGERAVVMGADTHTESDRAVLIGERIDYKGVMPDDIAQYAMVQSVAIGDQNQIGRRSVAVGSISKARFLDTAVGPDASAKGTHSIAIGFGSTTSEDAEGAIQLGYGTNRVPHTFNVGLVRVEDRDGDGITEKYEYNYQLLDADGHIPLERIPDLSTYATKEYVDTQAAVLAEVKEDAMSNMAEIADLKTSKQDKLIAGANITIKGNVISATGGSGGGGGGASSLEDIAVAGEGITFTKLTTVKDYTVEGSPTISADGEVRGFSDSNYLTAINPINAEDSLDSFEIYTAIKKDSTPEGNNGIIDTSGQSGDISFRLTSLDPQSSIRWRVSTDGNTTYPVDIIGSTVLETNKKYFIKVTYSSASGYALFSSVDGVSWTTEGTSSVLTRPHRSSFDKILIGDNSATGSSFDGSLYLGDTYINVNGKRAWTAFEEVHKTEIKSNVDLTRYLKNTSTNYYSGITIASDYPSRERGAINIGRQAQAANQGAVAIGGGAGYANTISHAIGLYSTAVGSGSYAYGRGAISISGQVNDGDLSQSNGEGSVAIGSKANAMAPYSIQIGNGTNNTANTFQVGNYRMLDSDGTIPAERLVNAPAASSVVATGTTETRTLSNRFAEVINVKDFGAKGDGVTDDTAAVQAAFVYAHSIGGGKVIFPKSTYLIANTSNHISIGANLVIDFCGSTILRGKEKQAGFANNIDPTIGSYEGGNIIIENGTIDCGAYENETLSNVGVLSFGYAKNITVRNMVFKNFQGYGHVIEVSGCDNVRILNCKFLGYKRGTDSGIRECIQLEAATALNYWWGTYTNDRTKNVVIDGCYFGKDPDNTNVNYTAPDGGIGGHGTNNGISVDNVAVVNCVFDGLRYAGVHAWCWKNALINNNLFIDCYNSVVLSVQAGTNNYDTDGNLIGYAFCGSDIMISNNVVKINTPNNVRRFFDSNEDLSKDSEQKRIKNVSIVNNIITSDAMTTDEVVRATMTINNIENLLIKGNNIGHHAQYCIQGNRNNYNIVIDGNKIENVHGYAISLANPTNKVTIKNNDINVNLGSSGIRGPIMISGVSNTTIKDNICNVTAGGTVYGIRVYGESDNIAILNNVSYGGSISYATATNVLQKGNSTFIDSWTSD